MDSERGETAPFERVDRGTYGYNIRQVDRFLAKARGSVDRPGPQRARLTSSDVRTVAFSPSRGGYEAQSVDAALDRLEDAFVQRERDRLIAEQGEEAWLQGIGRLSDVLRDRLRRAPGERFRRSARPDAASYDVADVDALCDQLLSYLDRQRPLSVDVVRRAAFRATRGGEGYEESQVDAFLDRAVELMAGID